MGGGGCFMMSPGSDGMRWSSLGHLSHGTSWRFVSRTHTKNFFLMQQKTFHKQLLMFSMFRPDCVRAKLLLNKRWTQKKDQGIVAASHTGEMFSLKSSCLFCYVSPRIVTYNHTHLQTLGVCVVPGQDCRTHTTVRAARSFQQFE